MIHVPLHNDDHWILVAHNLVNWQAEIYDPLCKKEDEKITDIVKTVATNLHGALRLREFKGTKGFSVIYPNHLLKTIEVVKHASGFYVLKMLGIYNGRDLNSLKMEDDKDVDSDDDSISQKACYTMQHLKWGCYDEYWKGPIYRCPFSSRTISGNDFMGVMQHAENSGNDPKNIGQTVNRWALQAKHAAYGVFLRRKYNKLIEAGLLPPPKTKEDKAANKRIYSTMAREGRCAQ